MSTDPRSITAMIDQLNNSMNKLDDAYAVLDPLFRELQALIVCCPYPMWFKDHALRMVYLNKAYELEYGVSVERYRGLRDSDIWPTDIARLFTEHDMRVIEAKQPVSVIECVPGPDGQFINITVVKWPLIVNNEILGVAGMSLGRAI